MVTDKCNTQCDICYLSCSPRSNDKLSVDDSLNFIRQALEIDTIDSVAVTGGEPFLYLDELITITQTAHEYGFSVTCGTNGFWATNEAATNRILNDLSEAGLTSLTISVDEFHQHFIPISCIRNIMRAANEISLNVRISSITTKTSKQLSDIRMMIGDEVNSFEINDYPCLPIGNALKKMESHEFTYSSFVFPDRCFSENALTIKPDGSVYPCLLTPALYLGNAYESNLIDIVRNFYDNQFCRIFERFGYEWFVQVIKNNGLPIALKDNYVSLCDLCHTIFEKKEYIQMYLPFL